MMKEIHKRLSYTLQSLNIEYMQLIGTPAETWAELIHVLSGKHFQRI